ncbi:MAG: hypothetical protein K5864_05355 [Bacteroidales bacterium]|nr:hypothetical protein [Bacteroidales bacterium]
MMRYSFSNMVRIDSWRFNFRLIARLLGMLLVILALSMVVPVLVSVVYADGSQFGLILSGVLILAMGLLLRNFVGVGATFELHDREGLWYTLIIWLVVPIMGALPYLFTSSVHSFTDAAFESFSGFTTTGSSIMTGLDDAPKGLLVWRSTSQWVGGLGLILFVVAILRRLNAGAAKLYESEFSGTLQRRLHPHMSRNVQYMWRVYILLTLAMFILLLLGGNGFVDSFCLALSTVSTGGFMTHMSGLAGLSSYSIGVVTVFMFLAGVNLAVLFNLFLGHFRRVRKDDEFRSYGVAFLIAVAICSLAFIVSGVSVGQSLKFSVFHIASTASTCGFYTNPPAVWPTVVSVVTIVILFAGASAGSTGGGIKIKRLMILTKHIHNYFVGMIHPHAVMCVKVGGARVEEEYISRVFAFVFLYALFVIMGSFVLTMCGLDIPNAFCMASANMSNLGPSPIINNMGGALDYVALHPVGKWTMIVLMLAGRLEIFALVAALMRVYWKSR